MRMPFGILLAAAIALPAAALAQAEKPVVAPRAVQAEFDGFIAKFRAALKANDSAAIARMSRLPFMNDASIADAAQFRAKIYLKNFTARKRACLQRSKAVYDRDGNGADVYSIFCDEDIFAFSKTPSGFLFTDLGVND